MLYLREVSSLYFHSRHTGRWRQSPALSSSTCEPASLSSPLFLETCPFQLSMWNQIACQYPGMKRQRENIWGRQRSTRSPFSVATNPVSLPLWLSKCNRERENVHIPRDARRRTCWRRCHVSETILGLWLINKKLLLLHCRKWIVSLESPPEYRSTHEAIHDLFFQYILGIIEPMEGKGATFHRKSAF